MNEIEPQKAEINIEENSNGEVIVTVLFNGTCSNINDAIPSKAYPYGETISALRTNLLGKDSSDTLRWNKTITPEDTQFSIGVDGPGSGNLDHHTRLVDAGNYSKARQVAFGKGVDENIQHVIKTLELLEAKLNKIGKKIDKVNVAGWSRGAAESIYLPSEMFKNPTLKDIPVNVFGIDPVPGVGNTHEGNCTLSPNVKNAYFIYAMDERSGFFSPIIPIAKDANSTRVKYVMMPGHHATLVGNPGWRNKEKPHDNFNFEEPGMIIRWMAEQFLMKHGSTFKNRYNFSREKLLELFAKIQSDIDKYRQLRSEAYIFPQLLDEERKATVGYDRYTNVTFANVVDYTGHHKNLNAVNTFHRFLLDNNVDPDQFFTPQEEIIPFDFLINSHEEIKLTLHKGTSTEELWLTNDELLTLKNQLTDEEISILNNRRELTKDLSNLSEEKVEENFNKTTKDTVLDEESAFKTKEKQEQEDNATVGTPLPVEEEKKENNTLDKNLEKQEEQKLRDQLREQVEKVIIETLRQGIKKVENKEEMSKEHEEAPQENNKTDRREEIENITVEIQPAAEKNIHKHEDSHALDENMGQQEEQDLRNQLAEQAQRPIDEELRKLAKIQNKEETKESEKGALEETNESDEEALEENHKNNKRKKAAKNTILMENEKETSNKETVKNDESNEDPLPKEKQNNPKDKNEEKIEEDTEIKEEALEKPNGEEEPISMNQLINEAISIISNYNNLYPVHTYKAFFHRKHKQVEKYVREIKTHLNEFNGEEKAINYLFSNYRSELLKDPDSKLTQLMSNALAKILDINFNDEIDIYERHAQMMRKVNCHLSPLATFLQEYKKKVQKSWSYRYIKSSKAKSDVELELVNDAIQKLGNNLPIENFNFSTDTWAYLNSNPVHKAEIRSLLLNKIKSDIKNLGESSNPNMDVGIKELQSDPYINYILHNPLISNQDLAQVIGAINLAKEISKQDPPEEKTQNVLKKQLNTFKQNPFLKTFAKPFNLFVNPQIRKEKLLKKLNKKIDEWHPNKLLKSYKTKRNALKALRTEVSANLIYENFETIFNRWNQNHGKSIAEHRNSFWFRPTKFDLILMEIREGEEIPKEYQMLSQSNNTPILIKQNNKYSLYGRSYTGKWEETKLNPYPSSLDKLNFYTSAISMLPRANVDKEIYDAITLAKAHIPYQDRTETQIFIENEININKFKKIVP